MTPAAIALVALAALFTMVSSVISGVMLFRIESRANRESRRDEKIAEMAGDVRSLREGMSLGAREAIAALAGRVSLVEDFAEEAGQDLVELRTEQRNLGRLVEGHTRSPLPHAHPPPSWPPQPA